ncbi:hypothetical protein [Parvibaculum sp.]|uniref:hypothetical protein n=1 Tax=Parvibaculum sp. TaxID=2024848 RepID=UPI001D69EBF1|nr:hypothetical protein [Parvibaculum sp.]MBX3488900.1 hypothetical protein [Parvibaculum sp.]MCW5727218.1 hypothetical protein [Parvibaculum sp.]
MKKILVSLVALVAVVAAAPAEARVLTTAEKNLIAREVKRGLIDPESAQFRWGPTGPKASYCAEVNSKNSLGGYTGFAPFMAVLEQKNGAVFNVVVLAIESPDTLGAVRKTCNIEGYDDDYFRKTE